MSRDELILQHVPLVRAIAQAIRATLPVFVHIDDLEQEGAIGLIAAVDRFDPARGSLASYAKHKIRGAILEYLRSLLPAGRDQHQKHKRLEEAKCALYRELGRAAEPEEIAAYLGVDRAGYERWRCLHTHPLSLDGPKPQSPRDFEHSGPLMVGENIVDPAPRPDETAAQREEEDRLWANVAQLPDRHRFVVEHYFAEDETLKHIGTQLRVNESRTSQMKTTALHLLRAMHAAA